MKVWDHVMYSPDPYGKYAEYRQAKTLTPHRTRPYASKTLSTTAQISTEKDRLGSVTQFVAGPISERPLVGPQPLVAQTNDVPSIVSPLLVIPEDTARPRLRPRSKLRPTERAIKIYRS